VKLIVAADPRGGIGDKNKLPWEKLDGDLLRFKNLTTGKVILMGRNTWESLPRKPLPNRVNVVVTSKDIDGIVTINKFGKDSINLNNVWLIGGAKLINTSWNLIDEIHLSRTFAEYTCDTFIDLVKLEKEFNCMFKENQSDHSYEIWKRK